MAELCSFLITYDIMKIVLFIMLVVIYVEDMTSVGTYPRSAIMQTFENMAFGGSL